MNADCVRRDTVKSRPAFPVACVYALAEAPPSGKKRVFGAPDVHVQLSNPQSLASTPEILEARAHKEYIAPRWWWSGASALTAHVNHAPAKLRTCHNLTLACLANSTIRRNSHISR